MDLNQDPFTILRNNEIAVPPSLDAPGLVRLLITLIITALLITTPIAIMLFAWGRSNSKLEARKLVLEHKITVLILAVGVFFIFGLVKGVVDLAFGLG